MMWNFSKNQKKKMRRKKNLNSYLQENDYELTSPYMRDCVKRKL